MNKVWETPCKNCTAKLVLIALADNANDEGVCWPSLDYIAKKCDLSRQGVLSQIEKLVESKFLRVERSPGRARNIYHVMQPQLSTALTDKQKSTVNAVTQLSTALTVTTVNGVDTNRKPSKKEPPIISVSIPLSLNTPEFLKAWDDWINQRRQIKTPFTQRAAELQIDDLEKWGVEKSIESIRYSIMGGYKGLFEPRDSKNNGKQKQPIDYSKGF